MKRLLRRCLHKIATRLGLDPTDAGFSNLVVLIIVIVIVGTAVFVQITELLYVDGEVTEQRELAGIFDIEDAVGILDSGAIYDILSSEAQDNINEAADKYTANVQAVVDPLYAVVVFILEAEPDGLGGVTLTKAATSDNYPSAVLPSDIELLIKSKIGDDIEEKIYYTYKMVVEAAGTNAGVRPAKLAGIPAKVYSSLAPGKAAHLLMAALSDDCSGSGCS